MNAANLHREPCIELARRSAGAARKSRIFAQTLV